MPELLPLLYQSRQRIEAFVDEAFRFDPSTHALLRLLTRDITVDGVDIAAGSNVFLLIRAACRDAEVFSDPDTFVMDRRQNTDSIAFGFGAHRSLVSPPGSQGRRACFCQCFRHAAMPAAGCIEVEGAHGVAGFACPPGNVDRARTEARRVFDSSICNDRAPTAMIIPDQLAHRCSALECQPFSVGRWFR